MQETAENITNASQLSSFNDVRALIASVGNISTNRVVTLTNALDYRTNRLPDYRINGLGLGLEVRYEQTDRCIMPCNACKTQFAVTVNSQLHGAIINIIKLWSLTWHCSEWSCWVLTQPVASTQMYFGANDGGAKVPKRGMETTQAKEGASYPMWGSRLCPQKIANARWTFYAYICTFWYFFGVVRLIYFWDEKILPCIRIFIGRNHPHSLGDQPLNAACIVCQIYFGGEKHSCLTMFFTGDYRPLPPGLTALNAACTVYKSKFILGA